MTTLKHKTINGNNNKANSQTTMTSTSPLGASFQVRDSLASTMVGNIAAIVDEAKITRQKDVNRWIMTYLILNAFLSLCVLCATFLVR